MTQRRRVAALLLSVVICIVFVVPGGSKVSASGSNLEAADFTSYQIVTYKGDTITVGVDGSCFTVVSDAVSDFTVTLKDAVSYSRVKEISLEDGETSADFADYAEEDTLYYVSVRYTLDGTDFDSANNYVFMEDGKLNFYKSLVYDFNVDRCSELLTDDESLKEDLMPQNDIECDSPILKSYSDEICEGATDDWNKVFKIYTYITRVMSYDDVQVSDSSVVYQDGCVCLLRRGVAICEGFGNVFTALCRAQGIPATVEFGIGMVDYDEITDESIETNESPDHAWAAVCLGNKWFFVDPTFDIGSYYEGDSWDSGHVEYSTPGYNYYLLPLEAFSYDHKICDADTVHGIEESGSCGDYATYDISRDGTLTIHGRGEIKLPYGCNGFSKVVFASDSDITAIGEECFSDCDLITSVVIPDTVTEIDNSAFNTCEDLEYVYLPEGLTTISKQAFDYCDELAYVRVPDSVTDLGQWAFDDCPRLYISVPSSLDGFDSNYDIEPMHIEQR